MQLFKTVLKDIEWRLKRTSRKLRATLGRGRLKAVSPKFWTLFDKDEAKVVRLAGDFLFTEGPIWRKDEGVLLFSDIPASRIYRYQPDSGVTIFRSPSNNANGLTSDPGGNLVCCEHGARRVTRTMADGTVECLADSFENRRLNSPNDVVARSDGLIFFTDPCFGEAREHRELPHQGVYCRHPDGDLRLAVDDFAGPNGLAFSPDESVIYVDDTERLHLRAFRVDKYGELSDGKILLDMKRKGWSGLPDGLKVDQNGNIYCTGPGGIWVLEPDGTVLGHIFFPEQPANLNWGGQDGSKLFVTAHTSLYCLTTLTRGSGLLWR